MNILLVRHGQTNYNALHLCNNDPSVDVHLNETGIKEICDLAEELKNVDYDEVYVSELLRTKQTADIINKYHDKPIKVDARLNDNKSGFEGQKWSKYVEALEESADMWTARFNDGESLMDVKDRVREFIDSLRTLNEQTLLIVSSQIIIRAFYSIVKDVSNEEARSLPVDNAACIKLEINQY